MPSASPAMALDMSETALRFSLTSSMPIPKALIRHSEAVLCEVLGAAELTTTHPQIPGLESVSFYSPEGLSSDFFREEGGLEGLREELRGPAIALGVDCALLVGMLASAGPGLVVTDVDSTFIHGEVIDMLAEHAGSAEIVAQITNAAMRGERDFTQSLRQRVSTLAGVDEAVVREIAESIEFTPGALALVRALHAHGAKIGLVSGGFHEVVDLLGKRAGVDRVLANRLKKREGAFTGELEGTIVDREYKAEALRKWAGEFEVPLERTVAMGDGANDLAMMEIAGLSVAVCAKPMVLEAASAAITSPRLDEALAFFGWNA